MRRVAAPARRRAALAMVRRVSDRARVTRTKRGREERADDRDAGRTEEVEGGEQGERLKAELDDLLDEIDDVLETNAEDFVKSYVQKGGE